MLPLRIVWTWRARAVATGLAAVAVAVTVKAALDPRSALSLVIGGALLSAVCSYMCLKTYVDRVDGDADGLRRRALGGVDTLAWSEVRGVRLVATHQDGLAIVHTRTRDLYAAFHLRLITEERRGRPWDFNRWMAGFDALLEIAAEREWGSIDEPSVAEHPVVARALEAIDRAHVAANQVFFGFALLFILFIASVGIVAGWDVRVTGHFFVDLVLVGVGLLASAGLVDGLIRLRGVRGLLETGKTVHERRTLWMANAAGLIGGVLVLVTFVPDALAGTYEHGWVTWVLVGFGVIMLVGALRD